MNVKPFKFPKINPTAAFLILMMVIGFILRTYYLRENYILFGYDQARVSINTLWSYTYQQFGQKKYNYLPSFHGRGQSGQLSYLPQEINPQTNNFNGILVQKRQLTRPLGKFNFIK